MRQECWDPSTYPFSPKIQSQGSAIQKGEHSHGNLRKVTGSQIQPIPSLMAAPSYLSLCSFNTFPLSTFFYKILIYRTPLYNSHTRARAHTHSYPGVHTLTYNVSLLYLALHPCVHSRFCSLILRQHTSTPTPCRHTLSIPHTEQAEEGRPGQNCQLDSWCVVCVQGSES